MNRRDFIRLVAGSSAAWPARALAQSPDKIHRVGLLGSGAPLTDDSPLGASLVRGLARHGYVPGKNLAFERRAAEAHADRLPRLLAEVAAGNVEVLVTFGYPAARAAKQGPLSAVAFGAGDPVGTGLVASLARPGGNLTGISDVSAEVTPKRMELLKQVAPNLRRVAMLWNADDLGMSLRYQASEAGARSLGISVEPLGVREPEDFNAAFAAMTKDLPDAILMVSDSLTMLNRKRVFDFAAQHRLPAIYEFDSLVRDGGLMSYGPDQDESFERVGALVDRILKGAKPAELPFEEPTLFKLAINVKAARSIDLEIPATLLARADEVIE
jgi:putative tryptophan/tyrosine transport system substrate-binding protein